MSSVTMKLLAKATRVNIQTMEILSHELEAMLRGVEPDVRFYGRHRYAKIPRKRRPSPRLLARKGSLRHFIP